MSASLDEIDQALPRPLVQTAERAGASRTCETRAPLPLRRMLAIADLFSLAAGWSLVVAVMTLLGEAEVTWPVLVARGMVIIGGGLLLLSAAGLYRRRVCAVRAVEIVRLGRVALALTGATFLLLLGFEVTTALIGALAGGITWFVLLTAERGVFREWIQVRRASGDFGAPVLVVGGSVDSTQRMGRFLADNPYLGFNVRGLLHADQHGSQSTWNGQPAQLIELVRSADVSGVILDAGSLTGDELDALVRALSTGTSAHVHVSSGLRGIDRRRITVSPLADETFLHVAPVALSRRQLLVKRAVDVALATLVLLVALPVLSVAALAIWLTDRGPILYRQERVGLDGERFDLFKLRTMVVDADAQLAALAAGNARNGPLFKLSRDPRVTPVGRFLRASSLDELPQLFNVLEGTMSLVGPRPALPAEVAEFDAELQERLTVKPGVTGLWQVEARDLPNFDLYRRYDLLYVYSWSPGLDLAIIARTATVVSMRTVMAVVPARWQRANAVLD